MEGQRGVFGELGHEELQESIDILGSGGGVVDGLSVGIRVADLDRLIKEDHVGVGVPAVRIRFGRRSVLCDVARTELEQETGGARAAGTAVEPEHEWVILWLGAALEEPEEEMLGVADVEVTRVLLDVGVAKLLVGCGQAKGVLWECRVEDAIVLDALGPYLSGVDPFVSRLARALDLLAELVLELGQLLFGLVDEVLDALDRLLEGILDLRLDGGTEDLFGAGGEVWAT